MSHKPRFVLPLLATACLLAIRPLNARAAAITWGPATNILGESDVRTNGTLVAAFNVGGGGILPTTVNGVTFASFAYAGASTTVGNFTLATTSPFLASNNAFGNSSAPFSTLTSPYQALLNSGLASSTDITLTIGGLTPGTYDFQWWSNDANSSDTTGRHPYSTTASNAAGVGSVGVNDNTSGIIGGTGQFAVGTFTVAPADNNQEVIKFSGAVLLPLVNGFQLRQTSSVVPLPPAAWAGLTTLIGLAALRLYRRRRRTPQ